MRQKVAGSLALRQSVHVASLGYLTALLMTLVVVGGGVAQAGEVLVSAIREALYRRSHSLAIQNLQLVRSEMGKSAVLTGAALAVTDELFAPDRVRAWIEAGSPIRQASATPLRSATWKKAPAGEIDNAVVSGDGSVGRQEGGRAAPDPTARGRRRSIKRPARDERPEVDATVGDRMGDGGADLAR